MKIPIRINYNKRRGVVSIGLKARGWTPPGAGDDSAWTGSNVWGEGVSEELNDPSSQLSYNKSWVYICVSYNARQMSKQNLRLYVKKKTGAPGFKVTQTRKVEKEQLEFLYKNPGLRLLTRKDIEIEEVLTHPFLDMMERVNPLLNQADLWMLTESFMGITGNCYWWIRKNKLGVPWQLWIMETQYMKPAIGKTFDDYIKGFVYRVGLTEVPFDVEEIVHHKYPSLTSRAVGMSPIEGLADSVVVNDQIYKYEKATFKNQARPDAVLESDEDLTTVQYNRIKKNWHKTYGGASRAAKVAILEGGLKFKPISIRPKDLNHLEGRKLTREEIADGLGIPIPLLSPDKSNLANATVAYKQYMRDTIDPKLKLYEQKMNEQLVGIYEDDNVFCAFDNCIPEDREFALKEQESKLKTGYSSINIERKKQGDEEVEWGNVPILPATMLPFGSSPPEKPPKPPKEEEETGIKIADNFEELADGVAKAIMKKMK